MPTKIMIIRHGEKPEEDIHGVDVEGHKSKIDLSPQGWQRSGALVRFFNPLKGVTFSDPALARPTAIFAAGSLDETKSLRSQHTVEALGRSLHLRLNLQHTKGEEQALLKSVLATDGVVLVAWEHNAIVEIANLLMGDPKSSPQRWPDSRFDLVWIFDKAAHDKWTFSEIAQQLLPDDLPHV